MKAKVVLKYRDKETNIINNVGDVIDVTEERFEEITKAGPYLTAVEEPEPEKKNPEQGKKDSKTEKTEKEEGKK